MRLVFALLADYAQTSPDGKLTIAGGDVDTVHAPQFPAVHAQPVSLVAKFYVDPEEVGKPHGLQVDFIAPDGTSLLGYHEASFGPESVAAPAGQPMKFTLVLNFPVLVFPMAGTYGFRVAIDGEEAALIPLYAEEQQPTPHTPTPEAAAPSA